MYRWSLFWHVLNSIILIVDYPNHRIIQINNVATLGKLFCQQLWPVDTEFKEFSPFSFVQSVDWRKH